MSTHKIEAKAGTRHTESAHLAADDSGSVSHNNDDFISKTAIIGVVVVGAALFETALIPGIILGAVAAYAPKYMPKIGERLQPLFHFTIRSAYKLGRKAKSAMGEVREQMSDIAAEVQAEDAVNASESTVIAEEHLKAGHATAGVGGHGMTQA